MLAHGFKQVLLCGLVATGKRGAPVDLSDIEACIPSIEARELWGVNDILDVVRIAELKGRKAYDPIYPIPSLV